MDMRYWCQGNFDRYEADKMLEMDEKHCVVLSVEGMILVTREVVERTVGGCCGEKNVGLPGWIGNGHILIWSFLLPINSAGRLIFPFLSYRILVS